MNVETVRLEAPGGDGVRAAFAPAANMVLHSLTLGDRELLAERNGLEGYMERGSTMGVPLLHPWANRLGGLTYGAAGTEVVLEGDSSLFKRDPAGLPMHGAWPTLLRWDVVENGSDGETASLLARLDWDPALPAFELFPFPHRLEYRARAAARSIELALALEPTADVPVPVSFGFHPYLLIPGGARHSAEMTLPVRRALLTSDSMLPTGETEPFEPGPRRLGDTEWDDEFSELEDPARFVLRGGESEVSLTFRRGYPFAHVFAPADSDFVCFEPMTAPTNALVTGAGLSVVAPGGRFEAAFEIAAG